MASSFPSRLSSVSGSVNDSFLSVWFLPVYFLIGIGLGSGQACRIGNKGLSYAPSEQCRVYLLEVSSLLACGGLLGYFLDREE